MTDDPWQTPAEEWDHFLPPLRPVAEDTAVVERIASQISAVRGAPNVMMLGVTREVAKCAWPRGVRLQAFDSSQGSIDSVWPAAHVPPGATATLANWSALPVKTGTIDLVTADGSLGCLDYPDGVGRVLAEVKRILRPGGRFIARTFLRKAETIEAIMSDLDAGRIVSPTILKMRVCGTMHTDGWAGYLLYDYWKVWERLFSDKASVAKRHGWTAASLSMLSSYEHSGIRFVYPTIEELRTVLTPCFREIEASFGTYAFAEQCPTLVLEPR